MTHLQKLRLLPILRWVSSNLSKNTLRSPKYPTLRFILPFYTVQNHFHCRFYCVSTLQVEEHEISEGSSNSSGETTRKMISQTVKREAQGALLDYLHSTRCLHFLDAEHMSKNSPCFLRNLIENVIDEPDIKRSMTRLLRYHPINEFEPFFESIGLEPCEFVPLLPRDLMFLSDEEGLLDNFHVLCEYGIARNKIGKIYREAREVFRYGHGVLQSRLQAFEELGINRVVVGEIVSSSPYLLIGDVGKEFVKAISKLKCLGFDYNWIRGRLLKNTSYNWRQIFELLCMLSGFGCDDKELGNLIGQHPELLFDGSGRSTFSLVGFVLKLGCTKDDICSMFLQFPSIQVGKYIWNLRRVSELLTDIEMDALSIGGTIRPHLPLLGTISLKKANSILSALNTGKKRLCDIIIANPLELKNWVLRAKIERLPEYTYPHEEKIKFLSRVGFVENSNEMERAVKVYRGKGEELQERFECLVKAGLSQEDAAGMVKAAPHILNQSKEVIESKISFLVHDLGYPVSILKPFPGFLSYKTERVKLRHSMYKWLIDQRSVHPSLSLSTLIASTDSYFIRRYVNMHPKGLEVWQELKKTSSSF